MGEHARSEGMRGMRGRIAGVACATAVAVATAACVGRPGTPPPPPPLELPAEPGEAASMSVRVDEDRRLVIMEAGPFHVPQAHGPEELHDDHSNPESRTPLLLFDWPVEGWYRGFAARVVDEHGDPLPAGTMHHVIGVNFDRRQVVYPVPERFMGVGTETRDILLPEQIGVPMDPGTRLGVYGSWNNRTGRDIENAYLRVTLAYTPRDEEAPEEVVPIYMDTNNVFGDTNAFDLPPGETEHSYEFTVPVDGALLGLGGHLHDYGETIRLEDAETGEVLVELEGVRDERGRIQAVEQKIFRRFFGLLDARIHMEAGRRYRVVGEYTNPTDETIALGGMAHLSGVFAPDTMANWARLDTSSEAYLRDVAALPEPFPPERAPPGVGGDRQASSEGSATGAGG